MRYLASCCHSLFKLNQIQCKRINQSNYNNFMSSVPNFQSHISHNYGLKLSKTLRNERQLPQIVTPYRGRQFVPFLQERNGIGKLISNCNKETVAPFLSSRLSESIRYDQTPYQAYEEQEYDIPENKRRMSLQQQIEHSRKQLHPKTIVMNPFDTLGVDKTDLKNPEKIVSFNAFRVIKRSYSIGEQKMNPVAIRKNLMLKQTKQNNLPHTTQYIAHQPIPLNQQVAGRNMDPYKFNKASSIFIRNDQYVSCTLLQRNKSVGSGYQISPSCKKLIRNLQKKEKQANDLRFLKTKFVKDGQKQLKVESSREHPELKRFQQMEKLSIKVIPDFQESHSLFLSKIRETKMMAIKIKQDLELD